MHDCEQLRRDLIGAVGERMIAAADELTELDRAIGDGDHGINMKRGCREVLAKLDQLAARPLPKALVDTGMTLVMKVGGASGPLYGTLCMALGKSLSEEAPVAKEFGPALTTAVAALKRRGKSDAGQKTMLDVWVPLCALLESGPASLAQVRTLAAEAAESTVPMQATRGRASFLGERSIGHMDPGARSSQLIIEAACDVLEGRS
jgi:dihydroxyacetone kinase-like protein